MGFFWRTKEVFLLWWFDFIYGLDVITAIWGWTFFVTITVIMIYDMTLAINIYNFIIQFKKLLSTKLATKKYLRWWDDGFSSQSWGSFEGRWYPGGGGGWRGCVVRRSAPGNPGASGGTSGPSWGEAGSGLAPDRWPVGHFRRLLLKAACRSSGWPHSSKFPVRKGKN